MLHEALAAHGLRLEDVRYVVNTHGHWDHIGGDATLKERGASIALHAADAPLLRRREAHLAGYWGERSHLAGRPAEAARAVLLEHIAGEVEPDRELADGDAIDLGGGMRLNVVHVPGHSAGSIALWWESEALAFVGDAVQGGGTAGTRCPFYVDPAAYRASLGRLASLRLRTLHGGHDFRWGEVGPIAEGEAAVTQALRRSEDAEALLRSAAERSFDPREATGDAALARSLGWDLGGAAPEPLGITLQGYRGSLSARGS